MTKNTSPKSKDSADKNRFNQPDQEREGGAEHPGEVGKSRDVGQFTGQGNPPLQKR